jgi:hypothetical protein
MCETYSQQRDDTNAERINARRESKTLLTVDL